MNSIKGTNARVLIIDDEGVETEIKGIVEASVGDLVSVSYDVKKETAEKKVIVIGAGGKSLSTALMVLGLSAERERESINSFNVAIRCKDDFNNAIGEVIKLNAMPRLEEYENEQPRNRDQGWYRKFDKCHGKRNKRLR